LIACETPGPERISTEGAFFVGGDSIERTYLLPSLRISESS